MMCALGSAEQPFYVILSLLWLFQLFILLATGADGFLAQNIAAITQRLKLSESLAVSCFEEFGDGF